MEVSGQLHAPAAVPPGKSPGIRWIGGYMDAAEKRKNLELTGFVFSFGVIGRRKYLHIFLLNPNYTAHQ
jgi:hypothetical protein